MKQKEIQNLPMLRTEHFENIFNVYQNEDNMYYYNLLQTVVFPDGLPETLFDTYNISSGDTWPYISYKAYSTPNLWWIIMFANKIMDPTKNPIPGNSVKIPKSQVVSEVLIQIGKK